MTVLGLGTYAYAWAIGVTGYDNPAPMDVISFLNHAAELGFRLVQIADNLPLDELSSDELALLLQAAQERKIAIEVGTRGIAPDHLRRYLEIAKQCHSPILRIVVDSAGHHPEPQEIITTLRPLLPEFEAANVTLAIENHDRFQARTLAQIMQELDSPYVGICLDTVNSFGALEGPEVVIDTLGPYVVNLHIKDFEIKRLDHNMGFALTGTPAGAGMLNIPLLLAQLHEYGRNFNAILELWPAWEGELLATCEKEDQWARQSVRYLRNYLKE
ncbi:MAG: sugar phosphate isomerase/epimerase [Anaerolineae bacterium]|nr:sugar phosphate isomerase/epimerase [Anaerolineae bacterium]